MEYKLRDGSAVEDMRFGRLYEADPRIRSFPVQQIIPTKVKEPRSYTWSIGKVLDQGREGSCVGHAVAHRLIARPVVHTEITHEDAVSIYKQAQTLDPWPGEEYEGTSVLAGAKAAMKRGYVTSYHWAETLDELIIGVGYCGPAVMGTWWHEGMVTPAVNGAITPTGRKLGGHSYILNGVNLRTRLFFGVNSWGESWGVKGRFVLSFEDAGTLLADSGEACFFDEVVT